MQELIRNALNKCDQAELYNIDSREISVEFNDGKLHNIESSLQLEGTL